MMGGYGARYCAILLAYGWLRILMSTTRTLGES
jgi:hypothetical protein